MKSKGGRRAGVGVNYKGLRDSEDVLFLGWDAGSVWVYE